MKNFILLIAVAFLFTACGQKTFVSIVEDGNGENVIRTDGSLVLKESFDKVFLYNEDYVKIMQDGKYGIVNYNGEMLIEPVYESISNLYNGYATITLDKKDGIVNEDMQLLLEPTYDSIRVGEGHFIVRNNGKYNCMNQNLEIISSAYDKIYYFVDGFARVELDNKLGFIDEQCKEVTEIKYDYAADFINGHAKVKVGNDFTFLNKKMQPITQPQFKNANFFEGK